MVHSREFWLSVFSALVVFGEFWVVSSFTSNKWLVGLVLFFSVFGIAFEGMIRKRKRG